MSNLANRFKIISFYRFVEIENKKNLKKHLDLFLKGKVIKGTVLISDEGINGSLAGFEREIFQALNYIKKIIRIRKVSVNTVETNILPFNRLKIRLKKEIISIGLKKLNLQNNKYASSKDWNRILSEKNTKIIDVRNQYEIGVGKFKNSIDPKTENFREFPSKFKKMNIKKTDKIAMYCTGGIRCEKASAFLKSKGFKNVILLKGGIINYLKDFKKNHIDSKWVGECFVFDNRVTINNNLKKGSYTQCFGCRRPLTKKDTLSINYIKGVHCSYCINFRSSEQKKKSHNRQTYIEWLDLNQVKHNFRSIELEDLKNL